MEIKKTTLLKDRYSRFLFITKDKSYLIDTTLSILNKELFKELKSDTRPRQLVKTLSGGQKQAVALSRTRLSNPDIVLMDEPTAAISVKQVTEVLQYILKLKEKKISIILISHRMMDVFEVCDRIMVLRRGVKVSDKKLKESSPEEVTGLITGAIDTSF